MRNRQIQPMNNMNENGAQQQGARINAVQAVDLFGGLDGIFGKQRDLNNDLAYLKAHLPKVSSDANTTTVYELAYAIAAKRGCLSPERVWREALQAKMPSSAFDRLRTAVGAVNGAHDGYSRQRDPQRNGHSRRGTSPGPEATPQ